MSKDKKKILMLFSVTPKNKGEDNWSSFGKQISKHLSSDNEITVSSLTDLGYLVDGENSKIWNRGEGWDIADFDLVIFMNSGTKREFAITAARYLQEKNVKFIDRYLRRAVPSGKLACGMQRSLQGITVVPTLGATSGMKLLNLVKKTEGFKDFPIILKADVGKKGRDNYLIKSIDELREVIINNPETIFVAQPFIPNDGDYRMLVMGNEVEVILKRTGDKDSTHLNNTSAGGSSKLVDPSTLPQEVLETAVRSAKIDRLSVAGVDLLQNKETGQWFVLEVNMSPQLISGDFHEEKVKAYAGFLERAMEKTTVSEKLAKNTALEDAKLIGRREWAGIVESGQVTRAKMDTGAYWSSLHVKETELEDEKLKVTFDNNEVEYFDKFRVIDVSSTKGEVDRRYAVRLNLFLGQEEFEYDVTLTQRTGLRYKLLLGRRALRQGGFIVDPSRSFHLGKIRDDMKVKLKERSK